MIITIPGSQIVDDAGNLVSGATVTVASITDKAGTVIAGAAATVNLAGPNLSVDYDAALYGEGWITLSVTKGGSAFTQQRAAPVVYASKDSGILALLAQLTMNRFSFNPATNALQLLKDDGVTAYGPPIILSVDASKNITAK
jgi:hypothetical protein